MDPETKEYRWWFSLRRHEGTLAAIVEETRGEDPLL
ncbi:hypothetical protein SOVF_192820 [Spinacia oleracea]|nr:hypothetical protein SOVF_192820 [Spinacia oleracea]